MNSLKQIFLNKKVGIKSQYLATQDKKWMRVIDSLAILAGIFSSLVILYFIYFLPEYAKSFPKILKGIAWGYFISLIPFVFLMYKESTLTKIERLAIVLFILLSTMSLVLIPLVAMKTMNT